MTQLNIGGSMTSIPVPATAVRVLPFHEWPRLLTIAGCPFAEAQTLPDPNHAMVLVEEDADGRIVGTWMLTSIMLLEGLWRAPEVRKRGVSAKRLLFGMLRLLDDRNVKTVITVIQDPAVEVLAQTAGFQPVPGGGTLYTLTRHTTDPDQGVT